MAPFKARAQGEGLRYCRLGNTGVLLRAMPGEYQLMTCTYGPRLVEHNVIQMWPMVVAPIDLDDNPVVGLTYTRDVAELESRVESRYIELCEQVFGVPTKAEEDSNGGE